MFHLQGGYVTLVDSACHKTHWRILHNMQLRMGLRYFRTDVCILVITVH